MFDANLRGVKEGVRVLARFHGKSERHGIIAGTYECIVAVCGDDDNNCVIVVISPKFRKSKNRRMSSVVISESVIGNRLVTFEGVAKT